MFFKIKATKNLKRIRPGMDRSSSAFKLSRRKSTKKIGNVSFPGNADYGSHSIGESDVLKCNPAAYINTGKKTSPGFFNGGCPQPPAILGTWGPGSLYLWTDYLKTRNPKEVATTKNVMGLPNGLSIIHWRKNNLNSDLDNSYSLEMITGWGSYSKKKFPMIMDGLMERYLICLLIVLIIFRFHLCTFIIAKSQARRMEWSKVSCIFGRRLCQVRTD